MTEYYQGQDVAVRFDVTKDGEETTPAQAVVSVYDSDKAFITHEVANVDGSEVNYVLMGDLVEKVGRYIFVFKVTVRGLGDYTHIVNVDVDEMPVPVGDYSEY